MIAATATVLATPAVLADRTTVAKPSASSPTDPYAAYIAEAGQRFGVPVSWTRAVMQQESGGDAKALSPKGAIGLMQVMPATYAELRIRYGLGPDPYNPRNNILAGTAYMRELHDRFGVPGFLAAYNAGPARYEEHLNTGRSLPAETLDYVARVAPALMKEHIPAASPRGQASHAWRTAPLFVTQSERKPADASSPFAPSSQQALHHRGVSDLSALAPQANGLFPRTTPAQARR